MVRKLTITVDEDVYAGLHDRVGRRRISRFLNELARPHVLPEEIERGYEAMSRDEAREREAGEWTEALIGDIADGRT
jgi:predicted CopG family antitoxin